MLTLYFSPGACSTASHIGLEETGAPYEEKPTLLAKGEHKTDAYLKVNPRGKVPALDVDGKILTENTAILTYLAQRFPEKKLMPEDPLEKARCISTMAWFSNTVHPAFTHIVRPERGPAKLSSGQGAQLKHNVSTRPLTWLVRRCCHLLSLVEFRLGPQLRRQACRSNRNGAARHRMIGGAGSDPWQCMRVRRESTGERF